MWMSLQQDQNAGNPAPVEKFTPLQSAYRLDTQKVMEEFRLGGISGGLQSKPFSNLGQL